MSWSRSSGRSTRPAGSPSTTHVRPGPCDSPAVIKRSVISAVAYLLGDRGPWTCLVALGASQAVLAQHMQRACDTDRLCRPGRVGCSRGLGIALYARGAGALLDDARNL